MMKKILWITVAILILGLDVPVSAQGQEYVGERLNLRYGDQKFPAGVPFHITHGWGLSQPGGVNGLFDFDLEIDGVPVQEDFIDRWADPSGDVVDLERMWVYNFPEGMTGTHYFTLHYYGTCLAFYSEEYCQEYYSPPDRNEVVEYAFTVKVRFVQ